MFASERGHSVGVAKRISQTLLNSKPLTHLEATKKVKSGSEEEGFLRTSSLESCASRPSPSKQARRGMCAHDLEFKAGVSKQLLRNFSRCPWSGGIRDTVDPTEIFLLTSLKWKRGWLASDEQIKTGVKAWDQPACLEFVGTDEEASMGLMWATSNVR